MTYHPMLQPMRSVLCLVVALASVVLPSVSSAQVLTGTLGGTVRDEQGLVLVGVQVRVSSPSLIGGSTGKTNEKGQLRFPALPPGSYALDAAMPKFTPYRVNEIQIRAGETIEVDLVLKLVSQSEIVDVAGSRIDPRASGFGVTFGPSVLTDIPTRRNGWFGYLAMAPGISPTSQATSFVSAWGSGVDQNAFLVDGTSVTAASNGIARSEPGIDFIQEMHVQLVGASAEYGNVQGAVIDIITRQGGNRFLWDGSYYRQPASLTSQPIRRLFNGAETGYERRRYRDATTTLGGPVVRDRIWFFAGYQYLRDEDSQPGADPDHPKRYKQDKAFGKLTWRLKPDWQLVHSVHNEQWDNRELPTATKQVEATQRLQASVPAVTFAHVTHTSSANRVWEASAGRFAFSQDISRSEGDSSIPGLLDLRTQTMSGAPLQVGELKQSRWTAKATLSQYLPGRWGGNHELKVGGQVDRGAHRSLLVIPTGVRYTINPNQKISSEPSNAGGLFVTTSVFATDTLAVRDRLTITTGLRFDYSRAISPDIRKLNDDGSDVGETIQGDGLLYTWKVLSPRIGAAVKLTADGRTMLRSSFGRFSQGILTGELSVDHPGVPKRMTAAFDPETGTYIDPPSISDPKVNTQIDPETRAPRTDAYSIGVDRELGRVLSAGLVYVRKRGRDFIGWEDVGGTYIEESRTLNGRNIPVVYRLTNLPAARVFELTNPKDYSLRYDGLAMVVEKRRSRGWHALASYTWSRASGLQPSSGTTAAGAQVATVGAPPVSFSPPLTFGQDPNALTNANGRLPNDRPHLFRVMGAFDLPKVGMMIAGNLQYSSGKPWAETVDLVPIAGQGSVHILLEPRGSRRLSSQTLFDLRVSREFKLEGLGRFDVRADVLNLLNDAAEEAIASDRFDGPHVGTIFLDPRRVMLSVKVNLGK